jgi:SHS family lactate transporter-like MFS transporter
LVYQLGNFLASANANIQVWLAGQFDGDYGLAMALVTGTVAVLIAVLAALGREPKGARMGRDAPAPANELSLVQAGRKSGTDR